MKGMHSSETARRKQTKLIKKGKLLLTRENESILAYLMRRNNFIFESVESCNSNEKDSIIISKKINSFLYSDSKKNGFKCRNQQNG